MYAAWEQQILRIFYSEKMERRCRTNILSKKVN